MANGVKKIKWIGESGVLRNFSLPDKIICVKPNQEALFAVDEWYDGTTDEEKRNSIKWLWMDEKKKTIFKKTIKPAGVPFGVTLPNKLCGSYRFYLEATLYGRHDLRNTGLHVYGKCEKKIISSSWSKKENTADNSEIMYGHDLYVTLEAEGINGDSLTLESYSMKKPDNVIETVPTKCVNGILKAKFKTMSCYMSLPGLPDDFENFYLKVLEVTGDYVKNGNANDKVIFFTIKNERVIPVFQAPTNTTPLKIDNTPQEEEIKIEGIITAYFAKEEFSLETSEIAGEHKYIFKSKNVDIDKDKIANIIKKLVDAQVKADKKYAKLDDIKNALTKNTYEIGDPISFNLCKLGAKFIKINSAPLEDEVYVVAKTFLLDGKEVTITIKEKETILADENTAVPVLETKENGEEITTLKATVENNLAKVKIKLRPKADEDLKTWKEKLLKGKKEGTYTYKFKSETVITDSNKKQFATIILNNAKEGKQGNAKIESGKTAFAEDVEKALVEGIYKIGDTISFDSYKTQAENLWLQAECQGETKKYEGEFLKRDGEYFVIGKKCECEERVRAFMRMLRDEEGVAGEKGYETLCGGESFIKNYEKNWDDHPQIKVYIKRINDYSSAAGAYQVMGYTWDGMSSYRKKYKIDNFNPENQDRFIVALLKHKRFDRLPESVIKKYGEKFRNAHGDMIKMILDQDYDKLFLTASLEWASFPDSPYGQQRSDYTIKEVKVKYDSYLSEELKGKSDLHIKKGFLQDFGYGCNCNYQNKKLNKQGYDIDKAVSYIEANAESESLSKCATYVRLAIEAGGLKSNAQPRNALNYFDILKQLGFTEFKTTIYIKGDIVVFDGVPGHQYGHIAMWTGKEWISDFKQKNIIVNNAYNNGKSSIFRWE